MCSRNWDQPELHILPGDRTTLPANDDSILNSMTFKSVFYVLFIYCGNRFQQLKTFQDSILSNRHQRSLRAIEHKYYVAFFMGIHTSLKPFDHGGIFYGERHQDGGSARRLFIQWPIARSTTLANIGHSAVTAVQTLHLYWVSHNFMGNGQFNTYL